MTHSLCSCLRLNIKARLNLFYSPSKSRCNDLLLSHDARWRSSTNGGRFQVGRKRRTFATIAFSSTTRNYTQFFSRWRIYLDPRDPGSREFFGRAGNLFLSLAASRCNNRWKIEERKSGCLLMKRSSPRRFESSPAIRSYSDVHRANDFLCRCFYRKSMTSETEKRVREHGRDYSKRKTIRKGVSKYEERRNVFRSCSRVSLSLVDCRNRVRGFF